MTDLRSLEDIAVDYFMTKYDFRSLSADNFRVALNEAITFGQRARWIAVADRLPEDGEPVIVCIPARVEGALGSMRFGVWTGESFEYAQLQELDDKASISHWMPLPEPPQGEK